MLCALCREVWRHCTIPGTFHAIAAAVWGLLQGKGFDLQLPNVPPHVNALIKDGKQLGAESPGACTSSNILAADTSSNIPAAEW